MKTRHIASVVAVALVVLAGCGHSTLRTRAARYSVRTVREDGLSPDDQKRARGGVQGDGLGGLRQQALLAGDEGVDPELGVDGSGAEQAAILQHRQRGQSRGAPLGRCRAFREAARYFVYRVSKEGMNALPTGWSWCGHGETGAP